MVCHRGAMADRPAVMVCHRGAMADRTAVMVCHRGRAPCLGVLYPHTLARGVDSPPRGANLLLLLATTLHLLQLCGVDRVRGLIARSSGLLCGVLRRHVVFGRAPAPLTGVFYDLARAGLQHLHERLRIQQLLFLRDRLSEGRLARLPPERSL